jgi:hypothetical protein
MKSYVSVREVYMVRQKDADQFLSEYGAWVDYEEAAIFETAEEAEMHAPPGAVIMPTEHAEPLIPLTLDELITSLQLLRARHGGDVHLFMTEAGPIAHVSFDGERGDIAVSPAGHEGAWCEEIDEDLDAS